MNIDSFIYSHREQIISKLFRIVTLLLIIGLISACVPQQSEEIIHEKLATLNITSNNSNSAFARLGNEVEVRFKSKEPLKNVNAIINGFPAEIISNGDGVIWSAARNMGVDDPEGEVDFRIQFEDQAGNQYVQRATINDKVIFDKTPPTITGEVIEEPSIGADGEEWYFSNVTVRFLIADELSGISDFSFDRGEQIINTTDIFFTSEGENQSVVGTVVDKAGNQASYTVDGINIKKLIIVAVMDGAGDTCKIFDTFEDAMVREDLDIDITDGYAKLDSSSKEDEIENAKNAIDQMTESMIDMYESYDIDKPDIRLLLIGKSLGGAKFYRMIFESAEELANFKKVAVVFVDTHSVPPADKGKPGWNGPTGNKYIHFTGTGDRNSTYNLSWFGDVENSNFDTQFNSKDKQDDLESKMRIFNIYSRRVYGITKIDSILGYSFSDAYLNLHAVNWGDYVYDGDEYKNEEVYNIEDNEWQAVTHFNIDNCRETRNLICDAISYIKY